MGKQKENTFKFALAVVALILALYLAELVVFFLDTRFARTRENVARQNGIPFDTRTVLEVIEDLQVQGVEACPIVPASLVVDFNGIGNGNHKLFTLGGVSQKATVYCNECGDYAIYESDEHGFNNPAGIWRQKPKAVLIGDSFTQGACVGSGEDIAGQLRKMGINTLNLGMGGCGPLIELAMMKEYVEFLQPEFVLWMYFEGNDLRELRREKTSFFARYYFDAGFSQNLLYLQTEIDQALIEFIKKYKQKEIERVEEEKNRRERKWKDVIRLEAIRARLSQVVARSHLSNQSAYPDPMFEAILTKAQRKASSWAGKLVFVYLPEYNRYAGKVDHDVFQQRREVLSIVRRLGIHIIDVHEVFSTRPDPLSLFPFRLYGHYTAAGYRLVAEAIASRLHGHPFATGSGTIFRPYNTVAGAVTAVPVGGIVSIAKGSYNESMTINKAMTITVPVGKVIIGSGGSPKIAESYFNPTEKDHQESATIKYSLSQNYPNPFNPETTIEYTLPEPSLVKLMIYDMLGQEVRTLVNEFQQAGVKSIAWDGKNNPGQLLPSGPYIYRIVTSGFTQSSKLVLLK